MIADKSNKENLMMVLRDFLLEGSAKTQEEICQALEKQGYSMNQTKISRLLRKLSIVKVKNECGDVVYWLPKEPPPPESSTTVNSLVTGIVTNEVMIIVHTSPGAAQLIARVLDYCNNDNEILGTIAGDNTIFIAPKSVKNIKKVVEKVRVLLEF
ncbi:MAG: ArgR family transcriptional regulator [bacterium]